MILRTSSLLLWVRDLLSSLCFGVSFEYVFFSCPEVELSMSMGSYEDTKRQRRLHCVSKEIRAV